MFDEKISSLNQTILECLNENDEIKVIKAFTDLGIKILDANFGFVWLNSYVSSEFVLVYKSRDTPYTPQVPRKDGRNFRAVKYGVPHYISDVMKYPDMHRISGFMKSLVIIPISYRGKAYGSIVLCFKKKELFSKEKKILCAFIGNVVAQAITIRRLMASQQEKAKTEFLAEATHELRTPLAIIKGSVDLALQAKTISDREIKRTLNDINYEVNHMSGLVSDLALLVNDGGSFNRKLASHQIKLSDILGQTVKRLATHAMKKHISFRTDDIPDVFITGDRLYLDKMFSNIVRNAITYGKENGTVKITCTLGHARTSGVQFSSTLIGHALNRRPVVHIDIEDDGIGIPKSAISHIFERFYRADNAREKNHDGTGLGLAIVKFIVEAHEGGVSLLSSKENKGSVFRLTLPVSSVA
jgi:signal transduction histidine kinase